jgi:hypothetical protein
MITRERYQMLRKYQSGVNWRMRDMDKLNPNLSDIIKAKITKIEFSKRPDSSSSRVCESSYSSNEGSIKFTLSNGLKLVFWNSEWGGLVIVSDESHALFHDDNYIDYTADDLEDKL